MCERIDFMKKELKKQSEFANGDWYLISFNNEDSKILVDYIENLEKKIKQMEDNDLERKLFKNYK